MKKKISKGVTIFGVLIIIGTLYNMIGLLKQESYKFFLHPLPERIIQMRYFISIIVLTLSLISGVGIFFLKDFFRKTILFTAFFTLYTYLIEGTLLALRNLPSFIEQQVAVIIAKTPGFPASFLSTLLWGGIIFSYIIDFGFAICLVYFFTRPKVREQFK